MHPADVLSQEHRIIEGQMDALEQEVAAVSAGGALRREFFENAADFFRNFADGCHHAKEENLLFPKMQERGVPGQGGPIGVMLAEHDQGRAYMRGMRENIEAAAGGSEQARQALTANAAAFVQLLRQHIHKEDQILFRMAHMVLQPDDVAELMKDFSEVEIPERFRALA
jgi:hemerythrin-like domain-containing protein